MTEQGTHSAFLDFISLRMVLFDFPWILFLVFLCSIDQIFRG
jgi:hypothetical protein